MLFLPKYGTSCVCADAGLAWPANASVSAKARAAGATGMTRGRIGKSFTSCQLSALSFQLAILLLTQSRLQTTCWAVWAENDAVCPPSTPCDDTSGRQTYTGSTTALRAGI